MVSSASTLRLGIPKRAATALTTGVKRAGMDEQGGETKKKKSVHRGDE
jgi:hypothetical protein